MGAEEVEYSPVSLAEVASRAVEFQPRIPVAAGIEPQAKHVFAAQRARHPLVEVQPVELPPSKEVREFARSLPRRQRILLTMSLHCSVFPGLPPRAAHL
jgi:hypothetical protein